MDEDRTKPPLVRRYPLSAFMLIACAYSWTLWLLMIASTRGWLPFSFPANPLGSFGPLVAALVLGRPAGVSASAREFLRHAAFTRSAPRWLVLAFIGPLLLGLVPVLLQAGLAGPLPALGGLSQAYLLPLVYLVVFVLGGPVGEEFGWRGYALPLLLRAHSPLVASLLLAALWVLWHLPLFWLEGAAQEGTSILGFGLAVSAASVLFTWLYLHTGPSLHAVLVLHTSINVWGVVLPVALPGVDTSTVYEVAYVAVLLLAAIGVLALDARIRVRGAEAG